MRARHEAALKMKTDMAEKKVELERLAQKARDDAAEEKETQSKFVESLEKSEDLEDNL